MPLTPEQYQKISRFLNLEMDQPEMDAFEKELHANPEMRHQLNFEQSIRDSLSLQKITSLPITAPASETAAGHTIPGKITGMQKWLAIGAAVVTAFMLFTIFWQRPANDPVTVNDVDAIQKKSSEPAIVKPASAKDISEGIDLALLFKKYFKKDALPAHYPLFLAEALTDYESGNYTTLQKLNLNNLPQTRGANETNSKETILKWGHYYKGLAFLQTNNTKEAAINLGWVLDNQPDKVVKAKTQWYLALTYLKENNREKAVELCDSIIKTKENQVLINNAEKILDIVGN